jgi:hypothetical protein
VLTPVALQLRRHMGSVHKPRALKARRSEICCMLCMNSFIPPETELTSQQDIHWHCCSAMATMRVRMPRWTATRLLDLSRRNGRRRDSRIGRIRGATFPMQTHARADSVASVNESLSTVLEHIQR